MELAADAQRERRRQGRDMLRGRLPACMPFSLRPLSSSRCPSSARWSRGSSHDRTDRLPPLHPSTARCSRERQAQITCAKRGPARPGLPGAVESRAASARALSTSSSPPLLSPSPPPHSTSNVSQRNLSARSGGRPSCRRFNLGRCRRKVVRLFVGRRRLQPSSRHRSFEPQAVL